MSTNHLSLELPHHWSWKLPMEHASMANYYFYQQQQQQHCCEREHLFEKPLTPSDVGKLNRLVIPKQHAEKHFPLDGESGEKGLLLSFEDESSKTWRFRYSYWTSSQSYVLTKGWSRFVKEKRLDAGDIVLFERRRSDTDRLYIGWKRRGEAGAAGSSSSAAAAAATTTTAHHPPAPNAGAVRWSPVFHGAPQPQHPPSSSYLYMGSPVQQDCAATYAGGVTTPPSPIAAATNSKRLRLFGVNLEYGGLSPDSSPPDAYQVVPQRELQFLPCSGHNLQL